MRPFSAGLRFLGLAGLLGLPCLTSPPLASQEPPEVKRFNQRTTEDLAQRQRSFVPLQVAGVRTGKNVVEVTLTVSIKIHEIDTGAVGRKSDRVRTRSYNCSLCGPAIRVRPGDQLKVLLKNEIKRTEPDEEYDPTNHTKPHGFNVTNLHTHGLNVSPLGRSDNVFLEVGPEESLDLCFDIPEDHACGTFWYHGHKHGSVALQLAGGMAGVLIVEGGKGSLDEDPAIGVATAKEHEKILVFQQIPYVPNDEGRVVDVKWEDVYAKPPEKVTRASAGKLIRNTLVNGELYPTIALLPGEVQRWRCVHAGLEDSLDLVLVKRGQDPHDKKNRVRLHEIAVDGLPLGTLETWTHVELQPGYRSDFLVEAPEPGIYELQSLPVRAERSIAGVAQAPIRLARVEVKGPPLNPGMKLPKAEDLKDYPKKQGLEPIEKVDNHEPIEIKFRPKDETEEEFWVNREPFTKERILFHAKLGTAEEWTLNAESGRHPFHVHVNPFQVARPNEAGVVKKVWRDTVFITDNDADTTKIRMRFKKFAGKTVLHCHNLRHEDRGMMAAFEIVGKDTEAPKCPKVDAGLQKGATAPDWELLGAGGKMHKWADYKGRKLLLVFSRGPECVHCRAQIQLLAKKENVKNLSDLGLAVVVVSPIAPEKLPAQNGFPFVALSDEAWAAFKAYRCHDGRALHGTYLIDSSGKVHWQDAGDEPFMDVQALLKEAGKLQ